MLIMAVNLFASAFKWPFIFENNMKKIVSLIMPILLFLWYAISIFDI